MKFIWFSCWLVFVGICCSVETQVEAQVKEDSIPHHRSSPDSKSSAIEFNSVASDVITEKPLLPTENNDFYGHLAYCFDILSKSFEQNGTFTYLASKEIKANGNDSKETRLYTVEKSPDQRQDIKLGIIFDPQFSPNGKFILFKFGNPDRYGSYNLYVLEVASNVVQMISKRKLTYRKTVWSPDSQYVAYVAGGDAQGHVTQGEWSLGSLRLYVCQWKTAEERLVVQNNTVRGSFAWTAPHTLIYAALPDLGQQGDSLENQRAESQKLRASRPNIYEYAVDQEKSSLLMQDGYLPISSPDGQWIAFFGSEKPDAPYPLSSSWMEKPGDAVLMIAPYKGGERKSLNLESGLYPYVVWMPDNRHLLTIQNVEDGVINGQAKVTEWDIQTGKFRVVTTLQEKDFGRAISDFKPLSFSADGATLFFVAFELVGRRIEEMRGVFMAERNSVHAMNLSTGEVSLVAQFKNNWGVDWLPHGARR